MPAKCSWPCNVSYVLQRLQDDELGDDPLLDELKKLRRYIFHWHGTRKLGPA